LVWYIDTQMNIDTAHPTERQDTPPGPNAVLQLTAELIQANLASAEAQEWLAGCLRELLDGEAGCLLFFHEGHGELVVKKAGQEPAGWVYDLDLDWEQGLVEKSIREKKALLLNEIPRKAGLTWFERTLDCKLSSVLCFPLSIDDRGLGAIAVLNKRGGDFTQADLDLLAPLATVVAHKVSNARLIQQLKVTNADLEASHWQLLRSRNTLRALFDSIPASIYIIDRKYTLMAINMHRATRANDAPNLLVGRQCYEALHQRDDVCSDCRVIETLFGGQNTSHTRRHWRLEDEAEEWEVSTYPICDDSSQIVQAIVFEQDVTEKRRLEATLAQSEKLAAVGQLAAGLAHEINNPLTAIIANAQLLQRELPGDDDKQELVDLITRAGARATQVVRNLLDLARKENYDFAPIDLNETLNRSLKLLQHELVARSVNLDFEPAEDLPRVLASQDHLQGVWINLLSNAIDALENGTRDLRISTRQQGGEVRVIISDTGKGIPPERLSRIFEPFYTTKGPGRGTGLGLSVCHRVIKQHGGRILVDSQLGVGTQFTVILPVSN
jgi:two-component system NtrC family sensor kinase